MRLNAEHDHDAPTIHLQGEHLFEPLKFILVLRVVKLPKGHSASERFAVTMYTIV